MKYALLFCSILLFAQFTTAQSVQLNWGSTDIRYNQEEIPKVTPAIRWTGTAWKGERVNGQAVLWTEAGVSDLTVSVSDLKNGANIIPASAIETNFVRYVMTDELSKDGTTGCGHRPDPSEWDSSLVADMLDNVKLLDVKARSTQPIWMNVWVPSDAKAGKYKGTLTISGKDFSARQLQIELNVLNHTLPAPKDWVFHLDLWQNPYAVARYCQVPLWSKEHFNAMRPIMKRLAEAGQKGITCSIMHKPWAGQTYDHFDSMIGRMKMLNGTWAYDYTVFDKWVEFMMNDVGIDKYIYCYTMIPWALRFDYYDQATASIRFVEAKPGEAAYEEYWGTFLKDFAKHLRKKGWFEKVTIAMDERGEEAMKETIKLIRKADPAYKISVAGYYHESIQSELHDLTIGFGHSFPAEVREARRKAGQISNVYTCCAEPRPNTFTFSPPAEASWLGWHAMAGDYDGYLRWAYNSWTEDPLNDSRFRTWAGGDCYLVYPDSRSSIRLERLIEGIQDYEKIRLLRKEFNSKGATSKLKKLNDAVSAFSAESITPDNAADMVNRARKILNSI
ncbi:hypothetical protein M2459_003397 [Parabacteroides sp. PF5-5]|uniref:DUF4091 domain-containing protein n=1 Tax=unclassified Parabacteroides TaxID=2649774 RepID=UPI0024752E77|nr:MULTISPECIES: glycoside hydrolase domain-containing protein [unclassified Parabacteroides]MDH6306610.1 hypothetical protein [Parabacteroides sp. PH5-39]MDH6317577.1 hypothetical protein [Parabacteroides sp. PF5-13]MDH6321321.1 hypothetical protein [Parabacteroides sp. PH5-13]MDH6325114.1 hypothetical protein [Parabacteroides sp. PH5-8]MDH6328823.1 hypothetical protein [Parabacteroides sp. PH5-41]